MERIEEKLLRCCSLRCERVVNRKPVPIPQVLFLLFYFLALLQFGENYNLKLHNCIVQSNFTQGVRSYLTIAIIMKSKLTRCHFIQKYNPLRF